ncbi:hypothetical protein GCM10025767_29960 [Thalassotalea piscium]|uniref:Uncharacterized protein n=1 Tax=Thalassotalea piscium TaxID=1230533 RepID=A0A7X0TT50_9GAMM|nr:hypothetical protein [Thalassotalea piscium]MBB6542788.1 hypothetical protein [Thalassotalea piscium]
MPLWSDLDPVIRENGFELVDMFPLGRRLTSFGEIKDKFVESNLPQPSRLVWGDFCYVKGPKHLLDMTSTKLKKASLIMHFIYKKYDLSASILDIHDKKFKTNFLEAYFK